MTVKGCVSSCVIGLAVLTHETARGVEEAEKSKSELRALCRFQVPSTMGRMVVYWSWWLMVLMATSILKDHGELNNITDGSPRG